MRVNYKQPVWVYRNLKFGRSAKRLYSVMQGGRVVQRRNRVLLTDCRFVVRERGRQKVLLTGRKNVHAFVVGHIATKGAMGIDQRGPNLPVRVSYNPHNDECFMAHGGRALAWAVGSARAVLLNEYGMTACYLEEK